MPRPPAKLSVPFAAISILAVVFAAVPGFLLEPSEHDGVGQLITLFGVPIVAAAILISIGAHALNQRRSIPNRVLWWPLGVLPVGVVASTVPSILQDPEYFLADSFWGFVGTLVLMLFLVYVALLLGTLVWLFVLFPITTLTTLIRQKLQGETVPAQQFAMPLLLLALAGIITVGALSLEGLAPGRASGAQIVMALLGIPGSYEVTWPLGLWLVRAIVAVVLIVWFVWERRRTRATKRPQRRSR